MKARKALALLLVLSLLLGPALTPEARAAGACGIGACSCTSCHEVYSDYQYYSDALHTMKVRCSDCDAWAMFGGTESHTFSGNTCIYCGYSKACSHSSTSKTWTTSCDWVVTCDACGTTIDSGTTNGPYTYGSWTYYTATQHRRSYTCSYGDSGTYYETASHSTTTSYGQYSATQHAVYSYCATCGSTVGSTSYGDHVDADSNGYCDACAYLMTRFSVTVPAALAMTVSPQGVVSAATNAAIVNNSTGAVKVTALTLTASNGWVLVPYTVNMADAKVDAKQIGFIINGVQTTAGGATEALGLSGDWTIARGSSLTLDYNAIVSAMSQPVNEQVLTLVFVLELA